MATSAPIKNLGLAAIIVLAVSVMVLMGIAVIGGVSDTLRTDTLVANENITLLNVTRVNLANTWVTEITSVKALDTTLLVLGDNYTVQSLDVKGRNAGITLIDEDYTGNWTLVNYTYKAASTGSTTSDLFNTGLAVFATFMAIIVLALVGKTIIRLFRKGR